MNKVLYYECKSCGTQIPPNTGGSFMTCKCRKIAIDGDGIIARIFTGSKPYLKTVMKPEVDKFVYRIKQVKTGLFFLGRGQFGKNGRYYGRVPSLKWVKYHGECIIEKYRIEVTN